MKPVAIITPWFGRDLKGGAEQHAWQVATRLASRGHQVEVLTTRCRSFQDNWAVNHHRGWTKREQGVVIRRFPVVRREEEAFASVNHALLSLPHSRLHLGVNPVSAEDAAIFSTEGIKSPKLLHYLKAKQKNYQAFVFTPYLYGPILQGLPLVANRAFLLPCLHDEVYAYLPEVVNIFHAAKGLLFISEGEAQVATRLYGPGITPKSVVAGAGVEVTPHDVGAIEQIQDFSVKQERFVLCLGRRDAGKNTDLLVQAYIAFKQKHPDSTLKLVLAGAGSQSFADARGVIDLGLVEESEKATLLAHCLALFQPSRNESYSRVMMEAWFSGRPVAAHRDCLATAIAVGRAQGGWLAATETEWEQLFADVDTLGEEQLAAYGTQGKAYAKENADWDRIIERYEAALGLSQPEIKPLHKPITIKEIHQLLPNIAYGDAISNHALAIRDCLRRWGYKSEIFTRYVDERVAQEVKLFHRDKISRDAGLIYHHSIGSEVTEYAIAHPGSKCLIYHNITPAEFFLPYRPEFARILEQGRAELNQLAQHFPVSVGDSAYNAAELAASGFQQAGVLPIFVNPGKWDIPADASLMAQLQDGKANLLFVGRLAPNKRQEHLLEAFAHYLTMDQEARLILAGYGDNNDPYYYSLNKTIQRLNLTNHVIISGQVNDAQLLAFYRTAHLFWSMSEHEGFCVPIVEAMWFDVPVLAYKSSAVPETLGETGLMFTSKDDLVMVAALAKLLVRDETLRAKAIKAQRQKRTNYLPQIVQEKLSNLVSNMEESLR